MITLLDIYLIQQNKLFVTMPLQCFLHGNPIPLISKRFCKSLGEADALHDFLGIIVVVIAW